MPSLPGRQAKSRYHHTALPIVHPEGYINAAGVHIDDKMATRRRLPQDSGEREEDEQRRGSLREETERDGEAELWEGEGGNLLYLVICFVFNHFIFFAVPELSS